MVIIDGASKSITAVLSAAPATTNPNFVVSGVTYTSTATTGYHNDGALNGTTPVTLFAAPGSSTYREIKSIFIYNADTAAVTLTIRFSSSGGDRIIDVFEVPVQASLIWSRDNGFRLISNGRIKRKIAAPVTRDLTTFYHVNNNAGISANYAAAGTAASILTDGICAANTFYARSFVAPYRKNPVLDRVGLYVTSGVASSNARIGIYANSRSISTHYPAELLFDSGDLSAATSNTERTAAPNLTLTPGEVYWAIIFASDAFRLRASAAPFRPFPLVTDTLNSSTPPNLLSGSVTGLTYGAFPAIFPSGVSGSVSTLCIVFLRYSA